MNQIRQPLLTNNGVIANENTHSLNQKDYFSPKNRAVSLSKIKSYF